MTKDEQDRKNQAVRQRLLALVGHECPPSQAGAAPGLVALEEAWVADCMRWLKGLRKKFPMPPTWLFAPGFQYRPYCFDLEAVARECQQLLAEEPVRTAVKPAPPQPAAAPVATGAATEEPAAVVPAPQ